MANSDDGCGREVLGQACGGTRPRRSSAMFLMAMLALPHGGDAGTPLFASSAAVRELTPEDWGLMLNGQKAWFVDFYADWCPHCMHFAPIWDRVATAFQGDSRVAFGAVDCAQHTDFCVSLQVGAYPTLRSFNLPGVGDSFKKTGAYVHDGEYHVDEQNDLMMLLRGKLLARGPDPKGDSRIVLPGSAASVRQYPQPHEPEASQHTATLRFYDAMVALTYALHQGTALAAGETKANLFKKNLQDNDLSLGGEKLRELVEWLSFLSLVVPSEEAKERLAELAAVARQAQARGGLLPRSVWIQALEERQIGVAPVEAGSDPSPYFKICTTYTCGLWTLFHLLTVSVSEFPSSNVAGWCDGSKLGQAQALERIRGFVANFFGCADCQKHFLSIYDGCTFGRCQLACQDGRGAALWLWQVHNNVTIRVADEQGMPTPSQWPPKSMCPTCWARDGNRGDADNSMMVFRYLVQAYTPAADVEGELSSFSAAQSLIRQGRFRELWSNQGVRLVCFLALAAVLIGMLCWWNARAGSDRSPVAIAQRSRGRPHYLRTQEEQFMSEGVGGRSRSMQVLHPSSIVMTM